MLCTLLVQTILIKLGHKIELISWARGCTSKKPSVGEANAGQWLVQPQPGQQREERHSLKKPKQEKIVN